MSKANSYQRTDCFKCHSWTHCFKCEYTGETLDNPKKSVWLCAKCYLSSPDYEQVKILRDKEKLKEVII